MSRDTPEAVFDHARAAMLTDVKIDGTRARGVRVYGPGSRDDVDFVLRKGQWFIKLIPAAARRSG